MTYVLIAVLALTSVVSWLFGFYLLRVLATQDVREREERQTLLDRIEAPGEVVVQREVEDTTMLPHVPMDDDDEFYKAQLEARQRAVDRLRARKRDG